MWTLTNFLSNSIPNKYNEVLSYELGKELFPFVWVSEGGLKGALEAGKAETIIHSLRGPFPYLFIFLSVELFVYDI